MVDSDKSDIDILYLLLSFSDHFLHDAVVDLLQVLLHLVRPGELLLTDRAGEHLPVCPLVVQKCVSLEAVLIFEIVFHS